MKKFQVKVCGITRQSDADLVDSLGGDMIGMIFYRRSPRYLTLPRAREISRSVSPVLDRVGVFVDENTDTILRIADKVRLNIIQLYGMEPVTAITRLQREGYKVIKAFGIDRLKDYDKLRRSRADIVMVDRITTDLPGGSGRTFDWSLKPERKIANLMLAGGISVSNIAEGIRLFAPVIIDVNSGVESSPGVKSPRKLKRFFIVCDRLRYGR